MAIPLYLAQTAAEFASAHEPPVHLAWMACHFSPYGTGLTNIPTELPPKSLLILNDRTPIYNHDPQRILETLKMTVDNLDCSGVLLDFQRNDSNEALNIAKTLLELPCPVAVSELYAHELSCPVFISPVPPYKTLETHIQNWTGREIWLEAAMDTLRCTVTEDGSTFTAAPVPDKAFHIDKRLHCHYSMTTIGNSIEFAIWRTQENLQELILEAESHGVTHAVGLWQELKSTSNCKNRLA